MRRLQTLHEAAFLIDDNEDLAAADALLEVPDERPDLLRRATIALEQNKAARTGRGKEAPLGVIKGQARTAGDEGLEVHGAG